MKEKHSHKDRKKKKIPNKEQMLKISLCLLKYHAKDITYLHRNTQVHLHACLTLEIATGQQSAYPINMSPITHTSESPVDPRTGLDTLKIKTAYTLKTKPFSSQNSLVIHTIAETQY
jgi:hypothetical protein